MDFKKVLGNIKENLDEKREHKRQNKLEQEEFANKVHDLLDKFEIPDFDDFLLKYLNQKPESTFEIDKDTGRERETRPSRKQYLDFVWEFLQKNEINYSQLKDYSLKNHIVTPNFFGEISSIESDKAEFENILNSIRQNFKPERISDEEHLQAQLSIFLKAKYPERKISREVQTKFGDKIDILIDDKYAFELKVPEVRTTLRNLGAQLEEYVEVYPNLCTVILDIQALESDVINEYVDRFKKNYGVQTILLSGTKSNKS